MDADEARDQSLSSFKKSVKEVVKQIDEKIPHNFEWREVKHYIEGAFGVSVLAVAYFPMSLRPSQPFSSQSKKAKNWQIICDLVGAPFLLRWNDGDLVPLMVAVAYKFRKRGYETEVCDEDCCSGESGNSHILVKW
jgi:hypothetical protein